MEALAVTSKIMLIISPLTTITAIEPKLRGQIVDSRLSP